MEENSYNDLITLIKSLASFVKIDANTFLWAKSQPNFPKEKSENQGSIYDMGGGNFYIALASLSFYSFLSKIYEIIFTEKNCEKLFKKDKKTVNVTSAYNNETNAVTLLAGKINEKFRLMANTEELEIFWKLMRHGLVHCYLPKGGRSTLGAIGHLDFKGDFNYYDYVQNLNKSAEFAIQKNSQDGFDINSDLLAIKITKIADWLVEKIAECPYDKSKNECINLLLKT